MKVTSKMFFGVGLVFCLLGLLGGGIDVYRMVKFDKVEADVHVTHGTHSGYKAHVGYDYGGTRYEDKILNSYNAFTMKDGKTISVYIDPDKPNDPHVTSFALEVAFAGFGGLAIWGGTVRGKKKDVD